MNSNRDIKELSMNFLLDCAFGQHKDLITAAIDKAYVDMASHTLKIFEKSDYKSKWICRYNATKAIRDSLQKYPQNESTFADWHEQTISKIVDEYNNRLNEGQAQKWLNMTIKYIFILREVLGDDDRLSEIDSFIKSTDEHDYYPPIDSYIIKGVGFKEKKTWSDMNSEEYKKLREFLGEEKDFLWELEVWGEYANAYKENAKESYSAYVTDEMYRKP